MTVCGAVDPAVELGSLICFDDLHFLANRLADGSLCTFHEQAGDRGAATGSTRTRTRRRCARALLAGAAEAGVAIRDGGCYGHVDGPRFNTKAEIRGLAAGGRDRRVPDRRPGDRARAARRSCRSRCVGYATDYANGVQAEATPVETPARADRREHGDVRARAGGRGAADRRVGARPAGIVYRFHSD